MSFLEGVLSLAFLVQVLRITVPYALAALGGCLSERAGVINIALEGKLLCGAFGATLGAYYTGSAWVGVLAGVAAGVAVGALYALIVVRFRADQIVTGVAINMLAYGLTRYLLTLPFDSSANSESHAGFDSFVLSNPLFWIAGLLVGATYLLLFHTRFGLRVRATGEHPEAAAMQGVWVAAVRWKAVLLAGGLAGLGGAWMSLGQHLFVAEMSAGHGYIALAAVIMGRWHPLWAAAACLMFGAAEALQFQLATSGSGLPPELLGTLPYVLTMLALAGFMGRAIPPAGLGRVDDDAG